MEGGSGSGSRWPLPRRESTKVSSLNTSSSTLPACLLTCTFQLTIVRVQRTFSTMAEGHRSSSPDSLFVPQDDHYDNDHASYRRRLTPSLALPPRLPHYPGDGFDFRRPVMSSSTRQNTPGQNAAVVDLTTEEDSTEAESQETGPQPTSAPTAFATATASRGPRFGREVIDLESEGEDEDQTQGTRSPVRAAPRSNVENLFAPRFNQRGPPTNQHHGHQHHRHSRHTHQHQHPQYSVLRRPQRTTPSIDMDDDLEIIDSRPVRRSTRAPRSVTPYPIGSEPIDLTGDDDVVLLRAQPHEGVNLDRPGAVAGTRTRSIPDPLAALAGLFGGNGGRLVERVQTFWGQQEPNAGNSRNANNNSNHRGTGAGQPAQARIHFGAAMQLLPGGDIMMDYNAPAFDMGFQGANAPPQPKYEPPPAAEPGFTRSPGEDEVVVCPNCGDELAMGDDELKQQVWVIKKCGHVSIHPKFQNMVLLS